MVPVAAIQLHPKSVKAETIHKWIGIGLVQWNYWEKQEAGRIWCLGCPKQLFDILFIAEYVLVAQTVKNLPAMQETGVWSLGQEDPLEKGMATHSSVLAWKIPGTEEPGGMQSMGSQSQTQLSNKHFMHHFNLSSYSLSIIKYY